jgi:thiol-disulfide isomerase/thioredoxin
MILATVLAASLEITGVRGERLRPLEPSGPANVLVFTATDCPVSNGYAPEIQRVCAAYAARGVRCLLVFEDAGVTADAVRAHLSDYRYGAMPAALDTGGRVAARVGATVTPEVAVVDRAGAVRYRGRIDNQYVAIGRQRRTVTVHDLTDALDAVIAGRPVAVPESQPVGCAIVPPEMRRKIR